MGLKAKIEAIIYAAEEPITIEQISVLVKDMVLAELAAEQPAQPEAEPEPPATQEALAVESSPEATDTPSEPTTTEAPEGTTEHASEPTPVAETEAPAVEANVSEASAGEETPAPEVASADAPAEAAPLDSATVSAPEPTRKKKRSKDKEAEPKKEPSEDAKVRAKIREILELLTVEYSSEERGMEIRQVAGGYRMATKPEHHDVVRAFAKSLKPPVRLSLAALETLAVIAYKQPITVPEISEIRGVESGGVIGTLLDRKLITTAGRKQVIGRPILYKTSKEFLMRFGLNDLAELPSMEEFEKIAADGQGELFVPEQAPATASDNAPEVPASEAAEPQMMSQSPDFPGEASEPTAQELAATSDDATEAAQQTPEVAPTEEPEAQMADERASSHAEDAQDQQPQGVADVTAAEAPSENTEAERQSAEAEPEQADAVKHE